MPEPMKKVRRRHPPADSLIIKGNKRGEEEILDREMTRNKKRKRVKKQKNRQEKTEEEPKMPVAKIVAPGDSSNKRCAEEIDENQLVSNKKVKTVDDTCGGVYQPDVIRKKNKKKKRDRKRKNRQEKMVVVEKPAKESSCEASSDKEVDLKEPLAPETKIVSATKDGLSGESESKDSPDEEVENRAVDPASIKKKGERSDDSDDWEPPEEFSSKEQLVLRTSEKPDEKPKKPVEAKTKNVITKRRVYPGSPFPPLPGGSKLLYMYNLSPSIQESDIVEFFKNDGEIDWITLHCMMREDRLGYAYVRFHTSEATQKALKRNKEKLIGHAVKLLESEERTIFDMFTPSDEHKYLFMGNLSPSVAKKDIINFFVDAGKVVSVDLITAGGHFKGYAHVKFASSTVAHKAIRRYGQMLHGRYVELELAPEKTIWYTYTPSSGLIQLKEFTKWQKASGQQGNLQVLGLLDAQDMGLPRIYVVANAHSQSQEYPNVISINLVAKVVTD